MSDPITGPWSHGITDPAVLAFLAANAAPLPARVELLTDTDGHIWTYDTPRDGWANGDQFIGDEHRAVLEALHGPCVELAV